MFLLGCHTSSTPATCDGPCNDPDPDGGAGTATLTWDAPTTYTDGTPLTVAGYHVYYGTASGVYGTPVDAKMTASYAFTAPSPGTYYFAVTAYDSSGSESVPSSEVSKALP